MSVDSPPLPPAAPLARRARHRLAVGALTALVLLWLLVGIAFNGVEGHGEYLVRLVALLAVTVGAAWLVATGFDARYQASNPVLVVVRLAGVVAVAAVALFVVGDPWVFAGESGSAVGAGEQVVIAGIGLAALAAAFAFQRRRPPAVALAGAPPPVGPAVAGPPPTGFRATVRRWPHLIVALALVGPLVVFEGLVWLLYTYCGPGGAGSGVVAVLVLTLPLGLPGVGVLRDRRWQRRAENVASPGFAVAFGTIVLVAVVHATLMFALLALFAAGSSNTGNQCFN